MLCCLLAAFMNPSSAVPMLAASDFLRFSRKAFVARFTFIGLFICLFISFKYMYFIQDARIAGKLDFFEEKFKSHDDVHMNMEARLIAATSMEVGGQMHTTRSRNGT